MSYKLTYNCILNVISETDCPTVSQIVWAAQEQGIELSPPADYSTVPFLITINLDKKHD